MGNLISHIPELAIDRILFYLRVEDAKFLMSTCRLFEQKIQQNRPFWLAKAIYIYNKDPTVFMRLKDPKFFQHEALVGHVCKADSILNDILENIYTADSNEVQLGLEDKVECMSIDERAGLIVVHLHNYKTMIYSLLRFGDPPLRVIDTAIVDELVIHGDILFLRHSQDPLLYHADVYNWRINLPMASLAPRRNATALMMKKSNRFLGTYDANDHCMCLYPLVENGYDKNPLKISFPEDAHLFDYSVRDRTLLAIFARSNEYIFMKFCIETRGVIQEFLVASPLRGHDPKIAFPHIMVTRVTRSTEGLDIPPVFNGPFYVHGARMRILGETRNGFMGPRDIIMQGQIVADGIINDQSGDAQFLFIDNGLNECVRVVYIGDPDCVFREADIAPEVHRSAPYESCLIASFGLSFVFVGDGELVLRRFYQPTEIIMQ